MRTSLYYLYLDLIVFGRAIAFVAAGILIVSAILALLLSAVIMLRPLPHLVTMPQGPTVIRGQSTAPTVIESVAVATVPLSTTIWIEPMAKISLIIGHAFREFASAMIMLTEPNGPPLWSSLGLAATAIIVPIIFAASNPSTTNQQRGSHVM